MDRACKKLIHFLGLDPRSLLVAAAGAAFCFSLVQSMAVSFLCLLLALALAAAGGCPLAAYAKRLAVANFFILFIWLTVPLTMPGESLVTLGPLQPSKEGVRLALLVTIKCNAILVSFLALTAGMSPTLVGHALGRLRMPPKLVFLFLSACRYIHVIREEWQRLQTSAALRGFVPRSSLHTYRTIGNMIGLVFINGIDRGRRVYEAMVLRGFHGAFHTVTELRATRRDSVFSFFFFLFFLFFGLLGGVLYWGANHG